MQFFRRLLLVNFILFVFIIGCDGSKNPAPLSENSSSPLIVSPAPSSPLTPLPITPLPKELLVVSFDNRSDGTYTDDLVRSDWKNVKWVNLYDRARIVASSTNSSEKCLEIQYPKGGVGPEESGGQFQVSLPAKDEYFLEYSVLFREGFDFKKGGKLPGLAGGRANTGGEKPTGDGWSARYMWRDGGKAVVYLYHLDQPTNFGEDLPLNRDFLPGQWHTLKQYIRLNSSDKKDGILQVWMDSELVLDRKDIRYRSGTQAPVDLFYFSTFHGGSSQDWGPTVDSKTCFDQFHIF